MTITHYVLDLTIHGPLPRHVHFLDTSFAQVKGSFSARTALTGTLWTVFILYILAILIMLGENIVEHCLHIAKIETLCHRPKTQSVPFPAWTRKFVIKNLIQVGNA